MVAIILQRGEKTPIHRKISPASNNHHEETYRRQRCYDAGDQAMYGKLATECKINQRTQTSIATLTHVRATSATRDARRALLPLRRQHVAGLEVPHERGTMTSHLRPRTTARSPP